MKNHRASHTLVVFGFLVGVGFATSGCSSDSGGGSGVSPSKKLGELTSAEIGSICDWGAARLGGYGGSKVVKCKDHDVTQVAPASRDKCVQSYGIPASCQATVGDFETCAEQ